MTQAAQQAPATPVIANLKPIPSSNFREEHIHVQRADIIIPLGWTIDDVVADPVKTLALMPKIRSMAELRLLTEQLTEYARVFVRSVGTGPGGVVQGIELIVLERRKMAEPFPVPAGGEFYAYFDAVNGHHVRSPGNSVKFAGLSSAAEAQRIASLENQNRPRPV